MPAAWQKPTDDSDYDLIALTLDRMEAAVGAGQRRQAEQARLEAYAFFEFGPERRLKSIDPGLATDVEGLIWFGAKGHDGLAELISKGASRREVRETRLALDERARGRARHARRQRQPHHGRHQRGDHRLPRGPRGGAHPRRHHGLLRRRPAAAAAAGAGRRRSLGLVASVFTWVLAQTLLESLSQYGEKLEAVVGLIAIGVLLLITNWFFHRVYWSEWIGRFHRQRRKLMDEGAGRLLVGAGVRAGRARAHERLPRGLRDRALPAVARAQRRRHGGHRGRGARPRADARRGGADVRAPAQAALQEDADRHRRC